MTDACNEAQPEGIAVPMKFPARMREFHRGSRIETTVSRVEKLGEESGEAGCSGRVRGSVSARVAVAA